MVKYDKETNLIEINEKQYFKLYKRIVKTCLEDGYLLPGLLEIIDVPEKYDYSITEKEKFQITEEASSKRQNMFMERELRYNMIDVPFSNYKLWSKEDTKLENEELLRFISLYPEYESILK